MTTPNNTVAGLAEKWREQAERMAYRPGNMGAARLQQCAHELEAALASPAPSAPVVDDAGVLRELIDRYRGQIDNHGEYHGDLFTRAESALSGVSAPVGVEVAEGLCDPVPGAKFGHHPDPAIDFCIEVESLEARMFDAQHGISKPGQQPESVEAVREAIDRAMRFRVGGDANAIAAKTALRALALTPAAAPRVEEPVVDLMDYENQERAAASEDGLEDRVNALYDELFCTGKHLHAKVPIDPKAIIRRAIATPEQPGSAVQGEARTLLREVSDNLEGVGCGPCVGSMSPMEDLHGRIVVFLSTTQPPAPAAEQGKCDHDEAEVCPRCELRWWSLTERPKSGQPEARGVEGMLPDALVPHAEEWYRLCERRFAVDRITISGPLAEAIVEALAATPNPVRAEQPEGKWKLVPVEPTHGMELALSDALASGDYGIAECLARAIAAAPTQEKA